MLSIKTTPCSVKKDEYLDSGKHRDRREETVESISGWCYRKAHW
jgi:hypothetical protein